MRPRNSSRHMRFQSQLCPAPPSAIYDPNISHKMSLFSFSTPLDIDIVLQDTDDRQTVDVKLDKNKREKCLLYLDGETVKGAVTIRPKDGKRLEHTGIKVQFVGTIGKEEKPRYDSLRQTAYVHSLQRCTSIATQITNSCRYRPSSPVLESYSIPSRYHSHSRTWKRRTNRIMASTSSYATSSE